APGHLLAARAAPESGRERHAGRSRVEGVHYGLVRDPAVGAVDVWRGDLPVAGQAPLHDAANYLGPGVRTVGAQELAGEIDVRATQVVGKAGRRAIPGGPDRAVENFHPGRQQSPLFLAHLVVAAVVKRKGDQLPSGVVRPAVEAAGEHSGVALVVAAD